jgi:geranylgeranyl reductase family protein
MVQLPMKNNSKTFDVVVVGSGPAGATCAYQLAKGGFRVALIDKQIFPRPKLCAGLLTWKTVDLLHRVYGFSLEDLMAQDVISHACHNYRVYYHRKEIARGRLDYPFHYVNRSRYDDYWARLAQEAGARFFSGRKVVSVDVAKNDVVLSDGARMAAGVIIGADGVWSIVRKALFPNHEFKQRWRSNLAMTIETIGGPGASAPESDYASLHFGHVPWGYAWRFPNPDGLILGIGGLGSKNDTSLATAFRQFIDTIDTSPQPSADWKGHALPFGNFVDPPGMGRILLAGDACGLADPLLGEGIYYAHRSGQLAAMAVQSAASGEDEPAAFYRRSLDRCVFSELRWIKFYRNVLFFGGLRRRYRGLRLFFRLFPHRLEAVIQGRRSFARLLLPGRQVDLHHRG